MSCHQSRRAFACLSVPLWLFLVLLCAPAAAQIVDETDTESEWDDSYYPYTREGVFVGINALFALENFDTDPLIDDGNNPLDISADDAGGFDLRAGYRIHPLFAGELLFQYWSGFEVKERTSGFDDKFDGWSLMANAKIYPLGGRMQPYLVMGVGGLVFIDKEGDDSAFAARMGGGVDFYITDRFLLDFEIAYMFPAGSLADFQFVTFGAGVQYRY